MFTDERDINEKIKLTLNTLLEKLKSNINNEEVNNEILQKFMNTDYSKLTCIEKCELLSNITETLSNEVQIRVKAEKALIYENYSLVTIQDVVKQKELQILELHTEIKELQQRLHDAELGKYFLKLCLIFSSLIH